MAFHKYPAAALLALGLAGAALAAHALSSGSGGGTQSYAPARFALIQGDVDVAMLAGGSNPDGSNVQKVMLKIDTVTGSVWVLQLMVLGNNNPAIQSAAWYPVPANAVFQGQNQND